jgi:hypothetical protein
MPRFPRDMIKEQVRNLVVQPLLAKAKEIATHGFSSYIAAQSEAPDDGLAKPMMATLLPPSMVIGSAIERSFVTSLGWRMDTILTTLAAANYDFSAGGKERYVSVSGMLPSRTITTIDKLIGAMSAPRPMKATPSYKSEMEAIKESFKGSPGPLHRVEGIRIDVFFLDKSTGIEYAIESKTQKADKGQLKDAKRDSLTLMALKAYGDSEISYSNSRGDNIQTGSEIRPLICTYYNPWGLLVDANFPTFDTWFERQTQFLVGRETWTLVGRDEQAYDNFMEILWEIHLETRSEFEKVSSLAFE